MSKYINYDLNQALIRLKVDMEKLKDVMTNKTSYDEYWKLSNDYPFDSNITEMARKVSEWVDRHYIEEVEDEEEVVACVSCSVPLAQHNTSCISLVENMCQECHTEKENN